MAKKTIQKLKAIKPKSAMAIYYQQKLLAMVETYTKDLTRSILRAVRESNYTLVVAQDAGIADMIASALHGVVRRWAARINALAEKVAESVAGKVQKQTDAEFRQSLKDAGWTVEFKMTAAMRQTVNSSIAENVALIKSIPAQLHSKVEQAVYRSVTKGGDIKSLVDEIQGDISSKYANARKRAILIANDQNRKMTSAFTRARYLEKGITKAIWMHSHAGKKPRPSHVAADRKEFDVEKGMLLDGEWIQPGQLINCFPGSTVVHVKQSEIFTVWRSFFEGKMVNIKFGSDLMQGTPNHPILTGRGWVGLGDINYSDKIVFMSEESRDMVYDQEDEAVTTFENLFESLSVVFGNVRRSGVGFNFYGDIPNGNVDEVSPVNNSLRIASDSIPSEHFESFCFTCADGRVIEIRIRCVNNIGDPFFSCGGNQGDSVNFTGVFHSGYHAIFSSSHDTVNGQDSPDARSGMSWVSKFFDNSGRPHSRFIELYEGVSHPLPIYFVTCLYSDFPEMLAQLVRIASDRGSSGFKLGSRFYKFGGISDKYFTDFSGHVYTLQSLFGSYHVGDVFVKAKNCRCTCRPVLEL